ncbi:MAG: hypothetical protein KME23_11720 [Goleter apudmare HA4340-LM2]|jgi:hypothetical protein|nr:hypothetical protein [Goleter apudmare HA4340-LM2]
MNIVKLILLACPVFIASVLMLANPAQASSIKSAPAAQITTVVYVPAISHFVAPTLATASNPIMDQLGCNCANCVKSKFQLLQGKLPSGGF